MKGEGIREYLRYMVEEKKIPYIDFMLCKGDKIIYRFLDGAEKAPTGKENLFLWSMTKPLTVACVMKLCEEGRLALSDEVEKYLPAYKTVFLLDENGNRRAPKRKMTVKHLLTMTAGLSYNTATEPIRRVRKETDGKADTLAFVNAFAEEPLLFDPGEQFQYSLCHDVLGAIVEVVSGKRFSKYMQETLFAPLQMQKTGFHLEHRLDIAKQYTCDTEQNIYPDEGNNHLILGENYESGGAGAIGNVEEYARFARMLARGGIADDGSRILKAETIKEMSAEQQSSFIMNNNFSCVQGTDYGYGLGVRVRLKETEWGLPKGEFGWDGAAGSYLMVDTENEISVVIGMHLRCWPFIISGDHLELVKRGYEELKADGLF